MSKDEDHNAELHKLFTDVLTTATGLQEPIASVLMVAFTLELCRRLGPSKLSIPSKPMRELRDECIRDELNAGLSADVIARRYNISTRTVYRLQSAE